MFFDFLTGAVGSIGAISEIVRSEGIIRNPEPFIRLRWDWEKGEPKLEVKDVDPFDFKKY